MKVKEILKKILEDSHLLKITSFENFAKSPIWHSYQELC